MQQPQRLIKNINKNLDSSLLAFFIFTVQPRLGQLNIPVTIGIPQEVIDLLYCNAQLVTIQIFSDFGDQGIQLGEHPSVRDFQLFHSGKRILGSFRYIHQNIPAGVP